MNHYLVTGEESSCVECLNMAFASLQDVYEREFVLGLSDKIPCNEKSLDVIGALGSDPLHSLQFWRGMKAV